ncbi:hypothetical protein ABPG72_004624 [Tetrahymena utriculariae]
MDILRLDIPDRLSLFKLPPTSNSKGYYFGDWKEQIWEGGLKLYESNDRMVIKFFKDGKLHIELIVPENYEEAIVKCEDSVRGFAIRFNNPNGGYTWMGLGFRDRNTAFDFRSRIIDFYERKTDDQNIQKIDIKSNEDFSLKKGEKISFSLGGSKPEQSQNKQQQQQSFQGNFMFDMPNSSSSNQNQTYKAFSNSNSNNNNNNNNNKGNNWDNWNFGSGFSDFSNFGNSQPQQNQQQQQQQQQQWGFNGNQQFWGFDNQNNSNNNNNFNNNNKNNNVQQWAFDGHPQQQQQQQQYQQQQYQQNQQQQQNQNTQQNYQYNQQQNNNTAQQPAKNVDLLDLI